MMEGVASFWKVTLGGEIFFACMTAVFARAFMESLGAGEVTGLFNNTVAYATTKQVNTHILAMAIAMFVGATNGALAALFTTLNLKLYAPAALAACCTPNAPHPQRDRALAVS